jgi:tetratricopeptide (TPR) repeat protein
MNLGNVRFKQGKLKGALDMYERTLTIHQEIGNSLGQANALTNLGSLQSKMGNYSDALEAAHQARSLYGKVGARTEGFKSVETLIKRLEAKQEGHDAKSSEADKAEGESPEASEPEG